MVTPNDILEALAELAEETSPGEPVYRNLTPQGFTRPSTLIVLDQCEGDANFGTGVVELRPQFTLTTFVDVDEYHHSHLAELHRRQMALTGLFLPGYVRVKDPAEPEGRGRAPKVTALKLAGGYDYDTVTVTFSLTLSRKDFMDTEQRPVMETLHLRQEATTYG